MHPWQAKKSSKLTTKQSLKTQRKRLNLVWPCLKVLLYVFNSDFIDKNQLEMCVYKYKLILRNLTCSLENQSWMIFSTEWFQMQREFATPFEEMSPPELIKCLQKFYLSARKRDGSFCYKKSLTWLFGLLVVLVLCTRENIAVVAGIYIEDITRWREDMNFIFEWQNK